MVDSTRALRHRNFYRKLEGILREIDEGQGLESLLTALLAKIGDHVLEDETGITSGRLYRRSGQDYVVIRSFGSKGKDILGTRVSSSYPIFRQLDDRSVTYLDPADASYDSELESRLGVGTFGAFCLDPDKEYVASFGFEPEADRDEVVFTLNALRYALVHKLNELNLEGQLREARGIQVSLLPKGDPEFEGYEIAGRSLPAEQVAGDIFDYMELGDDLLGLVVGDASGHGLPAALQVRDVITGLRMGVERDLKVTSIVERLNRVIHRSGLTSRFVSLFFGELERSGTFVYVNAGHDPALLMRADGRTQLLRSTGIVMGPLASATYRRELIHVEPGDVLLLYTDGLIERTDGDEDRELGLAGLEAITRRLLESGMPVAQVPEAILEEVRRFGGGLPWADDATVVIVRRLREEV